MSRSKHTNEESVPHGRGRKQNTKRKRRSQKRVRRSSINTDDVTLKRLGKSEELDKDPPNELA